jgi:hypothetical protein
MGSQAIVKWIDLVQDTNKWWALVNIVTNLGIPYSGHFSRRAQLHGDRLSSSII